ncbi:hypothetical protein [Herbaspirillum huttiense]|uniref:hypothetical protein n=1 Tax=Herbaspirillum huttiense TaxID=863372 RepID=UPI002176A081|nr:hypothetical protein [Herbaspirillum huttiense]UWE16092.1 hypothetical protein NY669_23915 [Herbaspirillum huttiense]
MMSSDVNRFLGMVRLFFSVAYEISSLTSFFRSGSERWKWRGAILWANQQPAHNKFFGSAPHHENQKTTPIDYVKSSNQSPMGFRE